MYSQYPNDERNFSQSSYGIICKKVFLGVGAVVFSELWIYETQTMSLPSMHHRVTYSS